MPGAALPRRECSGSGAARPRRRGRRPAARRAARRGVGIGVAERREALPARCLKSAVPSGTTVVGSWKMPGSERSG